MLAPMKKIILQKVKQWVGEKSPKNSVPSLIVITNTADRSVSGKAKIWQNGRFLPIGWIWLNINQETCTIFY